MKFPKNTPHSGETPVPLRARVQTDLDFNPTTTGVLKIKTVSKSEVD